MNYLRLAKSDRTNLSKLERNKYGHLTFTVEGRCLTGAEEVKKLEKISLVSEAVQYCLLSTGPHGYNKSKNMPQSLSQRLMDGMEYKVVIVPGDEISYDKDRTNKTILVHANACKYKKPLAGLIPHMRREFTDDELSDLDFEYFNVLHDKIVDEEGNWHHLGMRRSLDGIWHLAVTGWRGDRRWPAGGGFLFLV